MRAFQSRRYRFVGVFSIGILLAVAAAASADITLNQGDVHNVVPAAPVDTAGVLGHYGYHTSPDALMNLDGNGGLMAATPYGSAVLTTGPGNRGLDFNDDNDFKNTGAINQNDYYMNLFIGTLHVSAANAGIWEFRDAGDDDRAGIWIDLDQDGVFESSTPGLGTNRGEQVAWENTSTYTRTLAEGDYLIAFTHGEYGGGSSCDFRFKSPTMSSQAVVKPADAAQTAIFSYVISPYPALGNVTVNGDATLNIEPPSGDSLGGDVTGGDLHFANTQDDPSTLTVSSAGKTVVFTGATTLDGNGGNLHIVNTSLALNNVGGPGGLGLSGNGKVSLPTANTYQGNTTIGAGITVVMGNNASLGDESGKTTIQSGGTLDIRGFRAGTNGNELVEVEGTGVGGLGAIVNTGASQTSALRQITMTGDATFRADSRWDIRNTGGVAVFDMGGHTLTKVGTGELAIVSANILNEGSVNVQQGIFRIESATQYDGSGTIAVSSAATLDIYNSTATHSPNIVLQNTANLTINGGSGAGPTLTGTVALNGTANIATNSKTLTLDGKVTGSGGFNKLGANRLTLTSAANDFSGPLSVRAGTLAVTSAAALGSPASIAIADGSTLELNGGGTITTGAVTLMGEGQAGVGVLHNVGGDNLINASSMAVPDYTEGTVRIASSAGSLTVNSPGGLALNFAGLTVGGAGDVVFNTDISSRAAGTGAYDVAKGYLFNGNTTRLPGDASQLAQKTLSSQVWFPDEAAIISVWGSDILGLNNTSNPNDPNNYGTTYVGDLTIDGTGTVAVKFRHTSADDANRIRIDLNDNGSFESGSEDPYNGDQGGSFTTGTITLNAGTTYTVAIQHREGGGGARLQPEISLDDGATWQRFVPGGMTGATFNNTFTATPDLFKVGAGTVTLNGDNSYQGTTNILDGTLLVNGHHTGGAFVVDGGTLGGHGVIDAAVTVDAGNLSPGASIGTLTTGTLVLGAASNSLFELTTPWEYPGDSLPSPNDLVVVNGDLTLGGTLSVSSTGQLANGTYTLFIADSGAIDGEFLNYSLPTGYGAWIDYAAGTVNLNLVPEPSTLAMLLGLSAVGLLGYWRRRRSR